MILKNQFRTLVPNNFDIEKIIKRDMPDFEYSTNFFNFIIHYIVDANASVIDEYTSYSGKNFIQIKSTKFQSLKRNYKHHIEYLLKHKVLRRRPYIVGKKCFRYRLENKYYCRPLVFKTICDKNLVWKIYKLYGNETPNKLKKKYNFLLRHLNLNKIKIDYEGATAEVLKIYEKEGSYNKYQKNMITLNRLYNGVRKIYFKEKTDGRVHTPITSLSRKMRKYIKFEKKHLAEVDLSNSVLYFLFIALKYPLQTMFVKHIINISILVKLVGDIDMKELEDFGRLTCNGEIYAKFFNDFVETFDEEYFNKAAKKILEEEFTGEEEQMKKIIKRKILAMLFARNAHYKDEQKIFASYFPTILMLVTRIKKWRYKRMSHFLFQMEAHYMIDIVAREYNKDKEGKNNLLLTLHDCLITTEDNVENLEKFLLKKLEETIGVSPMANIKYWKKEQNLISKPDVLPIIIETHENTETNTMGRLLKRVS